MAILKIRDNEGVITNIAAIKGENGKSPIIKNGTWWIYDDDKKEYVDTGLGAEKETILTKDNIEAVLTGTITSHNHDDVYIKDAPSDSKQYVRYNGEWSSIDFSSANFATKEELNTKVDKVEGKVLSTNDYTTEEKNKLAGIAAGAEVNVNADWNATEGDALILNKPIIPSSTSELTNDSNYITSSEVDTKINSAVAAVYKVRGSVDNYESLPISNVVVGDVYNLLDTGANYACISIDPIIWDKLSETIDLSSYSTTEENDAKYQLKGDYITSIPDEYVTDTELEAKGYATATSVEAALATKLDSSAYTAANSTTSGYMSSKDYIKLSGIEENADVNIIEAITVNGDAVSVTDKTAVIEVNETHGVLLDTIPTDTTLTYQEDNKTKSFTIGMSAIYPDNSSGDGYGMHFFKGTTSEGNAIWGKAVSDEKYALKSDTYTKAESDDLFAKKSDTVKLLPSSVLDLMMKYTENGIMTEEDYNTLMSYAPNEINDCVIDYPGFGICAFSIQHDPSSVYVSTHRSLGYYDISDAWAIEKDTRFVTISYLSKSVSPRAEGEITIAAESKEDNGTVSRGSITLKQNGSGDKFLSDNGEYKKINTQTGIKLDQKPTENTLTYIGANGETLNFTVGMSAICPDASSEDGYSIYFFKGTTSEGKAIWGNSGSIYEHPKFTAHEKGLYKISVTGEGHVNSADPVVKEDITALGIPAQDTVYTHPSYTPHSEGLYKITVNELGHVSGVGAVTKDDITGLGIPAQDTTYSAGTGLSFSGTTINHASSITAGTAGSSSATSGSNTISIPYVTYNNTGHVTEAGTHTHTINEATTSASGLMSSSDKTKMDRLESYTTATTVASLDVNYQTIYVTLSENASLSASNTGAAYNGRTISAYVYTSSSVTITIPTSGNYVSMCGSSFTTTADGWVEFSLVCVNGVWHIAKLEAE